MTKAEFEQLVKETMDAMPAEFRDKIKDIALIVEDEPRKEDLKAAGARKGSLYGLFHGIALKDRGFLDVPTMPDRIVLYQNTLERDFRTREALAEQIRMTVLHEVGHFFGLSEKDLRKLGYG